MPYFVQYDAISGEIKAVVFGDKAPQHASQISSEEPVEPGRQKVDLSTKKVVDMIEKTKEDVISRVESFLKSAKDDIIALDNATAEEKDAEVSKIDDFLADKAADEPIK